jgi:hypothetical protein
MTRSYLGGFCCFSDADREVYERVAETTLGA